MEEIEEFARRVAVLAVAQGLFAIEGRQGRTGAEQSDQVDPQASAQHAVLFEELYALDVAAGEAEAGVRLEFEAVVERFFILRHTRVTQAFDDLLHGLEQRVLADVPA